MIKYDITNYKDICRMHIIIIIIIFYILYIIYYIVYII